LWNISTKTRPPSIQSQFIFIGEKENIVVEIALQHNDGYAEKYFTFANNINTQEGERTWLGLNQR